MATTIPQYANAMTAGYPGALADMVAKELVSLSLAGETPLPFGEMAAYGTVRDTCRPTQAGDTAANICGLAVMDRGARGDDAFTQYESVRLLKSGRAWVPCTGQPANGAAVYYHPGTKVFSSASATGNFLVPFARFVRSEAAGMAVLEMNGIGVLSAA